MSKGNPSTRLAVAAAAAALCLALAPTALGAKGAGGKGKPRGGTGTITLVLLDSTDGMAHYGQRVTFNVSTTATTEPWVNLRCYQNRALVAEGWEGFFEGALSDGVFGLYSAKWVGGDADCTAYLTKPDGTVITSTSFHAYP
jgi:hypothetical protein